MSCNLTTSIFLQMLEETLGFEQLHSNVLHCI